MGEEQSAVVVPVVNLLFHFTITECNEGKEKKCRKLLKPNISRMLSLIKTRHLTAQNMRKKNILKEYRHVGDIYSSCFFAYNAAAEDESLTEKNDSSFIQYRTLKCDRHELSCQS